MDWECGEAGYVCISLDRTIADGILNLEIDQIRLNSEMGSCVLGLFVHHP